MLGCLEVLPASPRSTRARLGSLKRRLAAGKAKPPCPADRTEMGPWETTGFVSDLDWAEAESRAELWLFGWQLACGTAALGQGRRLTPCLAFRDEGAYRVAWLVSKVESRNKHCDTFVFGCISNGRISTRAFRNPVTSCRVPIVTYGNAGVFFFFKAFCCASMR